MIKEEPLGVVDATVAPEESTQLNETNENDLTNTQISNSSEADISTHSVSHTISSINEVRSQPSPPHHVLNPNVFPAPLHHTHFMDHPLNHLPPHYGIPVHPFGIPVPHNLSIEDDDEEVEPVMWQPKQGSFGDLRKDKKRKKEKRKEDDDEDSSSSPLSTPKKNKVLAETEEEKCLALKRGGQRCLKKRKKDSKYCGSHDGSERRRYGEISENGSPIPPENLPSPSQSSSPTSSPKLSPEKKQKTGNVSPQPSSPQTSPIIPLASPVSPTPMHIAIPTSPLTAKPVQPISLPNASPTEKPLLDQQIQSYQIAQPLLPQHPQAIPLSRPNPNPSSPRIPLYSPVSTAGEKRDQPFHHIAAGVPPIASPVESMPPKPQQPQAIAMVPVATPMINGHVHGAPLLHEHMKKVPTPSGMHSLPLNHHPHPHPHPHTHMTHNGHVSPASSKVSPSSTPHGKEEDDKKKRKKKKKEKDESGVSLSGFSYLETDGLVEIWIREVKKGIRTKRGRCIGTVRTSTGEQAICGKVFARVPNCRRHSRLVHKAQQQVLEEQKKIGGNGSTSGHVTSVSPISTVNPNAVNSMASALNGGGTNHAPSTIMDAIVVTSAKEVRDLEEREDLDDEGDDDDLEDDLSPDFSNGIRRNNKTSHQLLNDDEEEEEVHQITAPLTDFVQCESCHKWRRVPIDTIDELPDQWYCYMNPDSRYSNCSAEQELPDWEIDKELQLEAIYIKPQFYESRATRDSVEADLCYHEEKNDIHSELDKLYDSLFSASAMKKEIKSVL